MPSLVPELVKNSEGSRDLPHQLTYHLYGVNNIADGQQSHVGFKLIPTDLGKPSSVLISLVRQHRQNAEGRRQLSFVGLR